MIEEETSLPKSTVRFICDELGYDFKDIISIRIRKSAVTVVSLDSKRAMVTTIHPVEER